MRRGSKQANVTIVTLLLEAFVGGAQQKDVDGDVPVDLALRFNSGLPDSCKTLLREASDGKWQPPAPEAAKGTAVYFPLFSPSFFFGLAFVCAFVPSSPFL